MQMRGLHEGLAQFATYDVLTLPQGKGSPTTGLRIFSLLLLLCLDP